jgi:hypothetical protein
LLLYYHAIVRNYHDSIFDRVAARLVIQSQFLYDSVIIFNLCLTKTIHRPQQERALATRNHAVSKALKAGANACIICPFIGCTAVIRSDKNQASGRGRVCMSLGVVLVVAVFYSVNYSAGILFG